MNESMNGAPYLSAEATLFQKDEAHAQRVRAATRDFPLPPPPSRFPLGNYFPMSVEGPVRAELRHAKEIRKYGGGMLARFEHVGVDLAFVASGRFEQLDKRVVCLLRTSAPRDLSLIVTPAVPPRAYFPRKVEPDEALVVGGNEALAHALLDPWLRGALLAMAMRRMLESFIIRAGTIELAWMGPFPRETVPLLPDVALAIVTTVARRVHLV